MTSVNSSPRSASPVAAHDNAPLSRSSSHAAGELVDQIAPSQLSQRPSLHLDEVYPPSASPPRPIHTPRSSSGNELLEMPSADDTNADLNAAIEHGSAETQASEPVDQAAFGGSSSSSVSPPASETSRLLEYNVAREKSAELQTTREERDTARAQLDQLQELLQTHAEPRPQSPPGTAAPQSFSDGDGDATMPGSREGSRAPSEAASPVASETASPVASETASPVASRAASRVASEAASPVASEAASPVASRAASPVPSRAASPVPSRAASLSRSSSSADPVPDVIAEEIQPDEGAGSQPVASPVEPMTTTANQAMTESERETFARRIRGPAAELRKVPSRPAWVGIGIGTVVGAGVVSGTAALLSLSALSMSVGIGIGLATAVVLGFVFWAFANSVGAADNMSDQERASHVRDLQTVRAEVAAYGSSPEHDALIQQIDDALSPEDSRRKG